MSVTDPDNGLYRAGDPDFMTSLARGLHVIRAFAGVDRRLTIADVSRATGLTRAVVRRCLYTLRELGYAAVGGRVAELAQGIEATPHDGPCQTGRATDIRDRETPVDAGKGANDVQAPRQGSHEVRIAGAVQTIVRISDAHEMSDKRTPAVR